MFRILVPWSVEESDRISYRDMRKIVAREKAEAVKLFLAEARARSMPAHYASIELEDLGGGPRGYIASRYPSCA